MKKKMIFAGVAMLLAAAAVTGFSAYSKVDASDLLNANVEALADLEGSGATHAICYNESRVVKGYTYINCSECPKKTYDEKGKGSYTKCFY